MRVQYLKLLYALAGLIWTGHSWDRLAAHVTGHIPISTGTLFLRR